MESIIHEVSKHHGHDHDEHDHHEHDHHEHDHHEHHHEECSCGCHHGGGTSSPSHNHDECNCGCHHDHHADEVFVSWGIETPHVFQKEKLEEAVRTLTNDEDYEGIVLRAKEWFQ